jgi:hypothetical protein
MRSLHNFYSSPNMIRMINLKFLVIPSTQHSLFCTASIITTYFDLSGSSSGVTCYIYTIIELQHIYGYFYNLVKFTFDKF